MLDHCISVPIVYDWMMMDEKIEKCKYVPFKRETKQMEDSICINFKVSCQNEASTTIWQAVGDKINAATFSINHEGTCSCDWVILANDKSLGTVTQNNTFNATVGDLEKISVRCENSCSDEVICKGELYIVVHYLIDTGRKPEKKDKKVTCFISDKCGIPENTLVCREVSQKGGRVSKCFYKPNGEKFFLERVSILIEGYISVKVTDLCDDSFVICTYPITLVKTFFLCAPDGTEIVCKIDNFFCNAYMVDKKSYKNCMKVSLSIDFCLSVQSIYNTVINIKGDICEPRAELIDKLC